jgi:hypothetical protein
MWCVTRWLGELFTLTKNILNIISLLDLEFYRVKRDKLEYLIFIAPGARLYPMLAFHRV